MGSGKVKTCSLSNRKEKFQEEKDSREAVTWECGALSSQARGTIKMDAGKSSALWVERKSIEKVESPLSKKKACVGGNPYYPSG